jgi:outer membrane protein assembly factor BamB
MMEGQDPRTVRSVGDITRSDGQRAGTARRVVGAILVCASILLLVVGTSAVSVGAKTPAPQPQGVVKWRFQVSGQYVLHPPAVGPDGGVVVASSTGDVYSLTADGVLRWVVRSGADGGPSIGLDGTVYVASMSTITAIAPNGSIRWRFTEPSSGQGVIAGPTVGPDGNVYAISDFGGLGAFALSPAGQLLWSNRGAPTFAEYGQLGAQIVFGSGRLFAAFDESSIAPSTIFGLSLQGAQQWARSLGGNDDPFMQQQRQPATGVDGSLYLTAMGGANGWSLFRVDPASGTVLWQRSPAQSNGMSPPSVGPDGSVYFSRSLSYLDSVTPTGQPRWTFFDGSIIDHPGVAPDGSVVVAGSRPNFGQPGSVRGWNAATGQLSWEIGLPNEDGGYQILYTQPSFSADGRTAYFGTAVLGGAGQFSFLYAVGSGAGGAPPPPPPPPPSTQCVVPSVVGMTLNAAQSQIVEASCSVGGVKSVQSTQVGIVLAQSPAPGTTLPPGGRVYLTVGRT